MGLEITYLVPVSKRFLENDDWISADALAIYTEFKRSRTDDGEMIYSAPWSLSFAIEKPLPTT